MEYGAGRWEADDRRAQSQSAHQSLINRRLSPPLPAVRAPPTFMLETVNQLRDHLLGIAAGNASYRLPGPSPMNQPNDNLLDDIEHDHHREEHDRLVKGL